MTDWIKRLEETWGHMTEGKWLSREDHDYYQGGTYIGVGPQKWVPEDDGRWGNKLVPCKPGEQSHFRRDICRIQSGDGDEAGIKSLANLRHELLALVRAADFLRDYEGVEEPKAFIYRARLTPLFEALAALREKVEGMK